MVMMMIMYDGYDDDDDDGSRVVECYGHIVSV